MVYLDLLDSKWFFRDSDKKALCLNPDELKERVGFIKSVLERSKKCVIFLPNEIYIEDIVEVFDDALINEDLQR